MAVTDGGTGGDLFPETVVTDRLRLERADATDADGAGTAVAFPN